MAKKLYASGRSRQRAERAKRTQARNVVTMNKVSEKQAKETARKTAARRPDAPKGTRIKTSQGVPKSSSGLAGKPKRSYPKDVTKRDAPKAGRFGGGTPKKYPTRGGGIRTKRGRVTRKVGGNTAAIDYNEFLKSLGAGSAQEKIIAEMKKK